MTRDPESTLNFTADVGPADIADIPTAVTLFVGIVQRPEAAPASVTSYAEYQAAFGAARGGKADGGMSAMVRSFFANGGQQARIAPLADGGGLTAASLDRLFTSLRSGAIGFNLACIVALPEHDLSVDAIGVAVEACVRQRALLLLDAPSAWCADPVTAISRAAEGADELREAIGERPLRNAALYFPCFTSTGDDASPVALSPCGAVAGIIARNDRERGVWTAPAGVQTSIVGADGLTVSHTDAESTALNLVGVNILRPFPDRGIVIWGARTLAGSRETGDVFRYIPIRRLAFFIEEGVENALAFAVAEPNDEQLWRQVRAETTLFLQRLFAAGALQGRTPAQAFFVRCGQDTMTADDIRDGRLNVQIGFAPLQPAEFVELSISKLLRRRDD